ncbi:hypothetical protein [Microlunatus sp. GCM10028923]|uniref:hypothetical protein n=1 Tax=Microlunatus sp. GCM10028923 TaxID=3273400 RepID=UPI00361B725C
MGNVIGSRGQPRDRWVHLSNAATAVLYSVIVIAGTDLASTPWQRRLISWIAGRDQAIFGRGAVDLELEDIGWSRAEFAAQQGFLRDVLATAATGHRWDVLDYRPSREILIEFLARVDSLVRELPPSVADEPTDRYWPVDDPVDRCPTHQVLLHPGGCLICHDR